MACRSAAGGAAGPAVHFDKVVRRYGRHVALDHLDLRIARGEKVALLGPNGAGKSTTISLLLGLLRPSEGSLSVLGTSPRRAMAEGRLGSMLQQGAGTGLPPGVRVQTVLDLIDRIYPEPYSRELVVELTGIAPLLNRVTNQLSGGEAQRVRFALAVAGNPELLFLDEPTAAMDVHARHTFWRGLRELADEPHTVIFATHHLEEADHADRVVVINRGRVVADGPGATLKAAVASRQVRFVLQDPDSELLDRLAGVTDVELRGTGVVLHSLDADATVRDLVASQVGFSDLEVVGARLEEVFMALTGGPPEDAEPGGERSTEEAPEPEAGGGGR